MTQSFGPLLWFSSIHTAYSCFLFPLPTKRKKKRKKNVLNRYILLLWDGDSSIFTCSNRTEKKRKHTPRDLPDGSGLGDHIQLLQIYERWDEIDYDVEWCRDNDLQVFFYFLLHKTWYVAYIYVCVHAYKTLFKCIQIHRTKWAKS